MQADTTNNQPWWGAADPVDLRGAADQAGADLARLRGIRRNFARRADTYDAHAGVQRHMAHELMARLAALAAPAERVLEIGCGTGYFTNLLRQAYPAAHIAALDLDLALVAAARQRLGDEAGVHWLVADGEALAISAADLIAANAAFQWLARPAEALHDYFQRLQPGGALAFATLGPRTFQELAQAMAAAARTLRLAETPTIPAQDFADLPQWRDMLAQAGFADLWLIEQILTVHFPTVLDFFQSLRATGATPPQPRTYSPRLLKAIVQAYEAGCGKNHVIPATYQLIFASARKPPLSADATYRAGGYATRQ